MRTISIFAALILSAKGIYEKNKGANEWSI